MTSKKIPLQKRKDIFLALVAAQDAHTMTVGDTERQVQMDFAITASQLHGDPWPADYAGQAARHLIAAARVKPRAARDGRAPSRRG